MNPKILTVLIIDDCFDDCYAYRRYLKAQYPHTLNIIETETGSEGLVELEHSVPEVILLDQFLPDMTGLEFLQQIQTQSLITPPAIILLTRYGDEKLAKEAIQYGAQDYVPKESLTAERLSHAINQAISNLNLKGLLHRTQTLYQIVTDCAIRIHQAHGLEEVFQTVVDDIHRFLKCDRVLLYHTASFASGECVAQSVAPRWPCTMESSSLEDYLRLVLRCVLKKRQMIIIDDIQQTDVLDDPHRHWLEQLQVKATIIVPIVPSQLAGGTETGMWGLIVVHHCSAQRHWNDLEMNLLNSLTVQLAIAIQQWTLTQHLELELSERRQAECNIIQAHRILKQMNKELEIRVAERTTALKIANAQLQQEIEQRKQIEHQLSQSNQALQRSNQELEQYAYVASHDLREPLRKIRSYADLLAKRYHDQLDDRACRYIDYMVSGASRLDTVIQDLLAYSRVGRGPIERTSVDLNGVIDEVTHDLSKIIHESQAQVILSSFLPVMMLNATQMYQLFQNLIQNAIKYRSDEPPCIHISAKPIQSGYEFSVTDNGIGIDPEFAERIFVIFKRLHNRDQYSGTGIGLSICKRVVEHHGGSIWLKPTSSPGTTMCFTLLNRFMDDRTVAQEGEEETVSSVTE